MASRSVAGMRSRRPMMLRRTPSAMQFEGSVSKYSLQHRRIALTSAGGASSSRRKSKQVSVFIPSRGPPQ